MKNVKHRHPIDILRGWLESTYGHPFSDGIALDTARAANHDASEVFAIVEEVNGEPHLRPSQMLYLMAWKSPLPEGRKLRRALRELMVAGNADPA